MPDLTTIIIAIIVVAIIWMAIKFIFKLTAKIFSCGCLLILVIGGLLFFTGYLQINPPF
jgi:hypothetical protein